MVGSAPSIWKGAVKTGQGQSNGFLRGAGTKKGYMSRPLYSATTRAALLPFMGGRFVFGRVCQHRYGCPSGLMRLLSDFPAIGKRLRGAYQDRPLGSRCVSNSCACRTRIFLHAAGGFMDAPRFHSGSGCRAGSRGISRLFWSLTPLIQSHWHRRGIFGGIPEEFANSLGPAGNRFSGVSRRGD